MFASFRGWTLIIKKMVERKASLANPKHQHHVSQCGEHDCSANKKNIRDYYEYPSLSHFWDELWLWGKWWKEKLFLQIKSINIMYHNMENMIVMPITKRMEIITSIRVFPFSRTNISYKENGIKKGFSCKSKVLISCMPIWRIWL